VGDHVGLGVALTTVLASLHQGKNATNVQFDTIRKTQTCYANAYDARENFSCMELINRWRSKEAAKGLMPNLPMRQVYTEVKSTLPTMMQYSILTCSLRGERQKGQWVCPGGF